MTSRFRDNTCYTEIRTLTLYALSGSCLMSSLSVALACVTVGSRYADTTEAHILSPYNFLQLEARDVRSVSSSCSASSTEFCPSGRRAVGGICSSISLSWYLSHLVCA